MSSHLSQEGLTERNEPGEPIPPPSSEFDWTIPLSLDTTGESLLSGSHDPVPEDSSIPRETIVEELRGTFLQAKLERPLRIGVHDKRPVYLLVLSFTFERSGSSSRIPMAKIKISFNDAPTDTGGGSCSDSQQSLKRAEPPAILAYYPKSFEGPVCKATIERSSGLSLAVCNTHVLNTGAKVGKKTTLEDEGRLTVRGRTMGRPEYKIVWTIRENEVSRKGIPNDFRLPLIVMPQNGRRFSASLGLTASYGIWRGPLAKTISVSGGSNKPVYFDPDVLKAKAKNKERCQFNQKIVVEEVGDLTDCDLSQHSTFQ